MKSHYEIAHMTKQEIPIAIAWAKREGWNPGLHDGECFYQADPNGFFMGKLNGQIIAIGSAVLYDEHFAFCGFYVVEPAYRGQGFGLELTKARLLYAGDRNVGIDGVIPMLSRYERLGYQFAYNNARYCGTYSNVKKEAAHPAITLLSRVDWQEIQAYDRRHFPAPRSNFLSCWIKQKGGKSLAYIQDNKLVGYGVIRPCYEGYKIGPLFADEFSYAETLFTHLLQHTKGQPFYLDIPEVNPKAIHLVQHYQLTKVFATARMYLKEEPKVALEHIYGITSFELG